MADNSEKRDFKIKYSAEITFSEETVKRLCLTQYNTFQWKKKFSRFIVAVLFIIAGIILSGNRAISLCMIAVGCFLITSSTLAPNQLARQVLKDFNGKFPIVHYYFGPEGICLNKEGRDPFEYSEIIRLIEDKEFLYLYVGEMSAHMIDSSTIKGKDEKDGLKKYISAKTGLEWNPPLTVLNISLSNILKYRDYDKKHSREPFTGERLPDYHE